MNNLRSRRFHTLALGAAAALATGVLACNSTVVATGGTGGTGGATTGSAGTTTGTGGSTTGTGGATTGTGGTGGSTGGTGGGVPAVTSKVDLVLAIDNSRGMGDKQALLSLAVPDLVKALVNPPCLDAAGNVVATPPSPLDACPGGAMRQFNPVADMHVGIVSSSLGGHGSDACSPSGAGKQSNDDKGHLLDRKDPTTPAAVETYQGLHFLAWDAAQKLVPPGEADIDSDTPADSNSAALVPSLQEMVQGVGQIGCGYESQLESWYRFLVDPNPYDSISIDATGKVQLDGTDKVLLDERKSFLRPDSALIIVMITDENDCSIRDSGQFYFAAQQKTGNNMPFHLPAARAVCAASPGDECCFSCGQTGPKDGNGNPICPADPTCKDANGKTVYLNEITDNINLRCYEQKRRFGIDFLNPTGRYVSALKDSTVTDRNGQVVPNPIYSDLDQSDGNSKIRTPDLVFLTGIVGVPWQDIARTNAAGQPDMLAGLNAQGKAVGGFKSAAELELGLPGKDYDSWGLVLGDLAGYGLAKDPFMQESIKARAGQNPVTGDSILPPGTPNGNGNKINGHEWSIPKGENLQFACTFPIISVDAGGNVSPASYDCSQAGSLPYCDCTDKVNDSPLCDVDPGTGQPTLQVRAKAYPGRRELAVLQGLGSQAVLASICPVQVSSVAGADFGYRPAVSALVESLRPHLQ